MANFKPGDLVQLKSGGPIMTVDTQMDRGNIRCVWFHSDIYQDRLFVPDTLKPWEPEDLSALN